MAQSVNTAISFIIIISFFPDSIRLPFGGSVINTVKEIKMLQKIIKFKKGCRLQLKFNCLR